MMRPRRSAIAFLALLLLISSLLAFESMATQRAFDGSSYSGRSDSPWSMQGQNSRNTWYSPQNLISLANVGTLNETWFAKIPNVAGTPIVSPTTRLVYVSTGG